MVDVLAPRGVQSVKKRDGRVTPYTRDRIAHAIEMAWRAELGVPFPDAIDAAKVNRIETVVDSVESELPDIADADGAVDVESIQDIVERQLMLAGAHTVARRYIIYRDARARARQGATIRLLEQDNAEMLVNRAVIREWLEDAAGTAGQEIDRDDLEREVMASIRDGMRLSELDRAIVLAGRSRIERKRVYGSFTSRALLRTIYSDVVGKRVAVRDADSFYADTFTHNIPFGIEHELYAPELAHFDLPRLAAATYSSGILDCRRSTIAISFITSSSESSFRKRSGCVFRWGLPWPRNQRSATHEPSNSMKCSAPSAYVAPARHCSMLAPAILN